MRKSRCIVIIALIICSLCVCVYAENITGLQEQSNELTEQLNESNNRLQAVQEEISQNMQQLQEVDAQISESQEEINTINIQVDELMKQIEENETKLEKTQEEYNSLQDVLNARLIAMYKAPKLQNLEVLLKSRSISDFISNYYLLKELIEYDTNLLEKAKKQKEEIETTKQILAE